MPLPLLLQHALTIPAVGSPMFLVSFPTLVSAQCKAGVVGTFPHVNARTSEQFDQWLTDIEADLATYHAANPSTVVAPYGVNLIVHRTNPRFEPEPCPTRYGPEGGLCFQPDMSLKGWISD